MADNMMRIAGRTNAGLAKAFQADNDGNLITTKVPNKAKEITLFTAKDSVGNSSVFDVANYKSVIFEISGTFTGSIRLMRRYDNSETYRDLPILASWVTGKEVSSENVTSPGIYVANIDGFPNLWARVNSLQSGSVTIKAKLFVEQSGIIEQITSQKRNILIGTYEVTVPANGFLKTPPDPIDISKYPLQYCTVSTDVTHDFKVTFNYFIGSINNQIEVIPSSVKLSAASDWIEAKSDTMTTYIVNKSGLAQNYTLRLYGIK